MLLDSSLLYGTFAYGSPIASAEEKQMVILISRIPVIQWLSQAHTYSLTVFSIKLVLDHPSKTLASRRFRNCWCDSYNNNI